MDLKAFSVEVYPLFFRSGPVGARCRSCVTAIPAQEADDFLSACHLADKAAHDVIIMASYAEAGRKYAAKRQTRVFASLRASVTFLVRCCKTR